MARWSDAMKLTDYRAFRDALDGHCGCYEIGYVRGGYFSSKYVGKAANLWNRISSYMSPSRCHNSYIEDKLYAERHNLWFHIIYTDDYHCTEARLQDRHGIGEAGLYNWNKRIERRYLGG